MLENLMQIKAYGALCGRNGCTATTQPQPRPCAAFHHNDSHALQSPASAPVRALRALDGAFADDALLERFNSTGPRYPWYPTADGFVGHFDQSDLHTRNT